MHDVLAHGLDWGRWDHVQFPGAVPRSFGPPVLLGVVVYPVSVLAKALDLVKSRIGLQVLGESASFVHLEVELMAFSTLGAGAVPLYCI